MANLKPPVGPDDHVQGKQQAPVQLVEYGDFQCPHCAAAHPILQKIQETFGDQIQFVFRHFPLTEVHPYAMAAAIAAEAAGLHGKFWEMHDGIFERDGALDNIFLKKLVVSIGLDKHSFEHDIANDSLQEKVEAQFESGVRSGVNGTPTFFVNGEKFDGGANDLYEMLRENAR